MIATSIQIASLRTALCESIRYQTKSEQNVRQDLIPRERHVEAALKNFNSYLLNVKVSIASTMNTCKVPYSNLLLLILTYFTPAT